MFVLFKLFHQEATQLANEMGNKALMARCMCSIADIYRELGESQARETLTVSWSIYPPYPANYRSHGPGTRRPFG